jgi:acetoin:2,6-dichlorophenolindophenol oxidoreductase subunit alpha
MTIVDVAYDLRRVERLALEGRPLAEPGLSRIEDDDLALMLLIRHFEWALLDLFSSGKLNGTTHTSLGQEYIPVALRTLLADEDFIFSNHRGHGHYIARFNDPAGLLAEIMGREGAICNGVGGSQHIYRAGYCSTGIQGAGVPVAAGVALHLKRANSHGLAVVYIGDGTWGQGSVYETLNIARLWELPLLVVVENNRIALSTPAEQGMAGTIEGRTRAFGVDYLKIVSRDINQIRIALAPPIRQARMHCAPLVIEFETDRLGPHSKSDDTRSADELADLRSRDWYTIYRDLFPRQAERVEAAARAAIERLVREVEARPLAQWRLP